MITHPNQICVVASGVLSKIVQSALVQMLGKTVVIAGTLFCVSSCSIVPAKLTRIDAFGLSGRKVEQTSLHALLEMALETPNEGDSAHALGQAVERWRLVKGEVLEGQVDPGVDSVTTKPIKVRFEVSGASRYAPGYFDELSPAVDFKVKKIERYTREGIGSPMRAVRENRGEEEVEFFFPPEGITREVTAIIHPGSGRGQTREVKIELVCALRRETVWVSGKERPLAADFSVALASLLEKSGDLSRLEVFDLLTPTPKRDPQLYLMERYDPKKEPLLMIHGLFDSPLAWAELTNALRADEKVRRRYQIWHYLYNTSAPALYSGRLLRNQYRELRETLDPDRNDRASRRTTLLTHSMGGLVARSLITDPGNAFWEAAFTRPINSLNLSSDDRLALSDAFFWKPDPSIKRVIFIAVPHRGSHYADNFIGKIGQAIVKPPNKYRQFYERISSTNPGAFTEAYADLGTGKMNSVSALSPRQPTLQILADLPLGYPVTLHSIMGNRGRDEPLEDSSDGIVPYWSSHLDEAASEAIVPTNHRALDDTETIEEVARILHLP